MAKSDLVPKGLQWVYQYLHHETLFGITAQDQPSRERNNI